MHNRDEGGVILGVRNAGVAVQAFANLRQRFGSRGVVQRHIDTAHTHALFLGMSHSPDWGPVVTVGFGGIEIETTRDTVSVPPPVTKDEARDLLRGLRGYSLLLGTRGRPPIDLQALGDVVAAFSRMCAAFPATFEAIDINPLVVGPDGVVAVDATVVLIDDPATYPSGTAAG